MADSSEINRREFLKSGAKAGAGLAAFGGITFITRPDRVFGANDRVRVAIFGVRGRGWDHVEEYQKIPNVEIAGLCDVDENVSAKRVADMEKRGWAKPSTCPDPRTVMDDKSIDAISIATPNHWHSLIAIWGCQSGKDVYVEKPCSHNWWEGHQLVAAAQKYNRLVQHGTQSRSSSGLREGVQKLREGVIGEVFLSRGLCYKWRDTIGHASIEPVPAGVHYDLWTGPAPMKPFTKNRFHYNWHWIWDTGNGDIGNQGIHEMDIARWGLGVGYPNKVSAMGGHFMFDDDQETPNTLNVACEFDMPDGKRKMLEFEVRHWMTNHEAGIGEGHFKGNIPPAGLPAPTTKSGKPKLGPDAGSNNTVGNIFYGSKGVMAMDGYNGYRTWIGEAQELGPTGHGGDDKVHFENFVEAVRSRKKEMLNAPIEEGHISCTIVHLANASYRLGRTLHFDPVAQMVIGDDEANLMLRDGVRGYRDPFVVPQLA